MTRALLVVLLAACGPGAGEIRFAKAQAYHCELADMVQVATDAAKPTYTLVALDKPDCPPEVWKDCVWQFAAATPGETEPDLVIELHRNADHQVMVEVDPKAGDQKQADHLLYRIYDLGKKYIPPPPPPRLQR